ncbi:MAG: hydrogenase expression/formation protein [Gammaproteobacteria bacterium]|jgi:hydrogenase-1 operon protein HyaF|nr:hydrogenase expression/formation protein [Gammaproteobacteria bacterium]
MSALDNIAVRVESAGNLTRNALPLLHEIRHALARLAESGESTAIDLRSIPFGPGDEADLLAALGTGEVTAQLQALGESRITETSYPGVWVVDHYNADGQRIAFQVEVTPVPQILAAQPADVADGLQRLEAALAELAEPESRPASL